MIYMFGQSCQEKKRRQCAPHILFRHFNNTQRQWHEQLLIPLAWMQFHNYRVRFPPKQLWPPHAAPDGCVLLLGLLGPLATTGNVVRDARFLLERCLFMAHVDVEPLGNRWWPLRAASPLGLLRIICPSSAPFAVYHHGAHPPERFFFFFGFI